MVMSKLDLRMALRMRTAQSSVHSRAASSLFALSSSNSGTNQLDEGLVRASCMRVARRSLASRAVESKTRFSCLRLPGLWWEVKERCWGIT